MVGTVSKIDGNIENHAAARAHEQRRAFRFQTWTIGRDEYIRGQAFFLSLREFGKATCSLEVQQAAI